MTKGNYPIHPTSMTMEGELEGGHQNGEMTYLHYGLTKREHFASLAMQGLTANVTQSLSPELIARLSVSISEELIKQLNQS